MLNVLPQPIVNEDNKDEAEFYDQELIDAFNSLEQQYEDMDDQRVAL